MKEIEKTQIKLLSDRLDLIRHQMTSMQLTNEAEKIRRARERKSDAGN